MTTKERSAAAHVDVSTQRGKPFEEMSPPEITKMLTKLKVRGLIRSKDQVRKLEQAVKDRREYCFGLEQLSIVSQKQLETAVANGIMSASEAESWKQHFATLSDEQSNNLIRAYPPEYQPVLTALSNISVTPAKLQEQQYWLAFYEKLIQPTTQLVTVYEKEIAQSKENEKLYERRALEAAQKRHRELIRAREVILQNKIMEENEEIEVGNPDINIEEDLKDPEEIEQSDAEAILSTLRAL